MGAASSVLIGLSAVVIALREGEAVVLTVQPEDAGPAGLPSGPFDPAGHRTFELALRAFVTAQTGFTLGYVEQLYTFGDAGRETPRAEYGGTVGRVVSVGYLALAPAAPEPDRADTRWSAWSRFFPYEDWRHGRPAVIDQRIGPALRRWAAEEPALRAARTARAEDLFALAPDARWNEERVLERYELLYEAGLAPEAARDRGLPPPEAAADGALGQPMTSDHRRILATGLGRLRGKLKYRPIVFDLMPAEFTLSQLQRTVEAISGLAMHKQNFRRGVERAGLIERTGRFDLGTGGRPAELFRVRQGAADGARAQGLSLPARR